MANGAAKAAPQSGNDILAVRSARQMVFSKQGGKKKASGMVSPLLMGNSLSGCPATRLDHFDRVRFVFAGPDFDRWKLACQSFSQTIHRITLAVKMPQQS